VGCLGRGVQVTCGLQTIVPGTIAARQCEAMGMAIVRRKITAMFGCGAACVALAVAVPGTEGKCSLDFGSPSTAKLRFFTLLPTRYEIEVLWSDSYVRPDTPRPTWPLPPATVDITVLDFSGHVVAHKVARERDPYSPDDTSDEALLTFRPQLWHLYTLVASPSGAIPAPYKGQQSLLVIYCSYDRIGIFFWAFLLGATGSFLVIWGALAYLVMLMDERKGTLAARQCGASSIGRSTPSA
jgi:hypothetical protein